MLNLLRIKNFALVEYAEADFSRGLNVISGESGSGKSILIGALFVLLGGRSDKDCIRDGEKRCEIEAVLEIPSEISSKISAFCSEYDIEENGNELILRRVLQENSARSYVNGSSLPLKAVRELAALFFDFNRPDEELSLNSQVRQLELLDRFGSIDLESYRTAYENKLAAAKELESFESQQPDSAELEAARELVNTMKQYNFSPDEEEELLKRHKILSNGRELINSSMKAAQILSGEENSITEAFNAFMRELYNMDKLTDGALTAITEEAENVNGSLNALQNSLDVFASKIELDGEALTEVEDRLDTLYRLKRRYNASCAELFIRYENAESLLKKYENTALYKQELQAKLSAYECELQKEAQKLTSCRKKSTAELEKALLAELDALGFKKCRFEWSFNEIEPTAQGADELDILFSANSGEKVLPLRKIASSGERSRLFLAIKNVLARVDDIPVVIFDEIDANIGGETANKVGTALRELGKFRQIITISHLAQIASQADTHYQVSKYVRDDGRTVSEAVKLDRSGRIAELARMLGNGDGSLTYAENLISTQKFSC